MVGIDAVFEGNTPAWSLGSTRSGVKGPTSELGQTGFSGFYDQPDNAASTTRRHYDDRYYDSCPPMAEPSVTVAPQSSYYQRRKAEPDSYRPHLRQFPKPQYPERPDRRKYIPDPNTGGNTQVIQGIRAIKINDDPGHMDLPPMPHLMHGRGMHCTVQDRESELLLNKEMGRKFRSTQDGYFGQGYAGDMSSLVSCEKRIEDYDPWCYKTPKDAPTFTRFVNSCAPSPAVPHSERRRLWYEAKEKTAKQAEVDMVKGLDDWDPTAPPKRMDVPDPDEEDPEANAPPADDPKAGKKKK